ncbi:TPA: hypothetical protein ACH3X1_005749 [Trebouxia sp. C0004]
MPFLGVRQAQQSWLAVSCWLAVRNSCEKRAFLPGSTPTMRGARRSWLSGNGPIKLCMVATNLSRHLLEAHSGLCTSQMLPS